MLMTCERHSLRLWGFIRSALTKPDFERFAPLMLRKPEYIHAVSCFQVLTARKNVAPGNNKNIEGMTDFLLNSVSKKSRVFLVAGISRNYSIYKPKTVTFAKAELFTCHSQKRELANPGFRDTPKR